VNESTYQKNQALLEKKNSGLSFLTHISEHFEKKPFLPPAEENPEVDLLYVYGLGLEYPHLKKAKEIVFIEEDPEKVQAFLETDVAEKLLKDERTHIYLNPDIEMLAETFPVRNVEVIKSSSYQDISKFEEFRLKILRKTTLSEGLYLDRLHAEVHFEHFLKNLNVFPKAFLINKLKGAFNKKPCIIVGAGPSLTESIEDLRNLRDHAFIIAGGSAISALSKAGITPHMGVAVDPNLEEYYRLKRNFAFEMPLVYTSRLHPGVFSCTNGPFGYLRSVLNTVLDLWAEEAAGLDAEMVGEELSPESMSVTTTALSLASFLGFDPIIFLGVDLGYSDGKRYADGIVEDPSQVKSAEVEDVIYNEENVSGKTIESSVKWIMERDAISTFIKKSKSTYINTSKGLKFPGISHKDLKELSFSSGENFEDHLHFLITQNKIEFQGVEKLLTELKKSIERCLEHLRELQNPKSKAHSALAEMDLLEERAYEMLFYDTLRIIKIYFRGEKKEERVIWTAFYEIVQRYLDIIKLQLVS